MPDLFQVKNLQIFYHIVMVDKMFRLSCGNSFFRFFT